MMPVDIDEVPALCLGLRGSASAHILLGTRILMAKLLLIWYAALASLLCTLCIPHKRMPEAAEMPQRRHQPNPQQSCATAWMMMGTRNT
jgi:hypothetical protein